MHFEATQYPDMMGSKLIDQCLSDIPLFGENPADIMALVLDALQSQPSDGDQMEDLEACSDPLPDAFTKGSSTADKLRSLRNYSKESLKTSVGNKNGNTDGTPFSGLEELAEKMAGVSTGRAGPASHKSLHEKLLALGLETKGFPKDAQVLLDHVALLRANDKYLFDFAANRDIVSDDPWLRDLWDWVAGKWARL